MNDTKKSKLLILENVPETLTYISVILQDEGYDIFPAETLDEAIEHVNNFKIDAALLDIRLEGQRKLNRKPINDEEAGIEFAKFLLKKHDIPVIFLTGLPHLYQTAKDAVSPYGFLNKGATNFEKDLPLKIGLAIATHYKKDYIRQHYFQKFTDGKICIKYGENNRRVFIHKDDILYIKGDGSNVELHTENKTYTLSMTLKNFTLQMNRYLSEEYLSKFKSVHRSYIVNFDKINGCDSDHVYVGKKEKEVPVTGSIAFLIDQLLPAFKSKPLPRVFILTNKEQTNYDFEGILDKRKHDVNIHYSSSVIESTGLEAIDLAIVDMQLSPNDRSGVDAARKLLYKQKVPLIFLSGVNTDEEIFKEARDLSPFTIINKDGDTDGNKLSMAVELALLKNYKDM